MGERQFTTQSGQREVEGLRAFAQSLSNAGLGKLTHYRRGHYQLLRSKHLSSWMPRR